MKKVVFCLSLGMAGSLLCYTLPATALQHVAPALPRVVSQQVIILNKDNARDLARLKGLGVKRAQAVVTYRKQHGPFKSVNDLVKVKGVGAKLLARVIKNNPGRMQLNAQ